MLADLLGATGGAQARALAPSATPGEFTAVVALDLSAAGTFVPSSSAKVDVCWTSSADGLPGKSKENDVEA